MKTLKGWTTKSELEQGISFQVFKGEIPEYLKKGKDKGEVVEVEVSLGATDK